MYDLAILLLSAASPAVSTQSLYPCPHLGADVSVPISLSTSTALKVAISGLKNSLNAAPQSSTAFTQLDAQNTSFSIDMYFI